MDTLTAAVTVLILLASFVVKPRSARCPDGWHNNGIRPSGEFSCTPRPSGPMDWDGVHGWPERSTQPPGNLGGRIYCTGGMRPVVVDERVVGCQRR